MATSEEREGSLHNRSWERATKICLSFVHKNLFSPAVYNWFEYYSGVNNTRLIQQNTLVVPFARTNICKRSIRVDATVKWNGLPEKLGRIEIRNQFKIKCKKLYVDKI